MNMRINMVNKQHKNYHLEARLTMYNSSSQVSLYAQSLNCAIHTRATAGH